MLLQFYNISRHAIGKPRICDLSAFDFGVAFDRTSVNRRGISCDNGVVLCQDFCDESHLSEFVFEAFQRCVIGSLRAVRDCGPFFLFLLISEGDEFFVAFFFFSGNENQILRAMKEAPKTVVVTGTLTRFVQASQSVHEVIDFVDTFQRGLV